MAVIWYGKEDEQQEQQQRAPKEGDQTRSDQTRTRSVQYAREEVGDVKMMIETPARGGGQQMDKWQAATSRVSSRLSNPNDAKTCEEMEKGQGQSVASVERSAREEEPEVRGAAARTERTVQKANKGREVGGRGRASQVKSS
jgi:hypothetical protein